ncbi:hypothetical protein BDP27DRAFT_1423053 [Rhodocollybia butyracea]|uniref:Uncharacterized protein n=1 Tax=Rhodocollybia butyracea TaxID=206335 RepID=A0A9P5PPT1_9AGAR|nr:hypothetical protein BDP27DRAFT_1423053 [Rhodocollybia butyracea]
MAEEESVPKQSVGWPRGSGHKQKAQKEAERQRRLNPASYQPTGLVVPGTSVNASTWDVLMHPPSSFPSTSLTPSSTSINEFHISSESVSQTCIASESASQMHIASESTSQTCTASESVIVPSKSLQTVLKHAQHVALSSFNVGESLPIPGTVKGMIYTKCPDWGLNPGPSGEIPRCSNQLSYLAMVTANGRSLKYCQRCNTHIVPTSISSDLHIASLDLHIAL